MALIASTSSGQRSAGPRPAFVPSPQQARFLDALDHESGHILLEARAGSGKSTTCREGAWTLHGKKQRSVYCCFNSHIAREFQGDLPPSCRAATMHSLGYAMLRVAFPHLTRPDEDKVDRLAERFFPERHQRPERRAVERLVNLCRDLMIDGDDQVELFQLAADYDVDLPIGSIGDVLAVVPEVLDACEKETTSIDFGDMIWMPTRLGLRTSRPPDVLIIDEAQDLNACQHALLSLLCPDGRVVVVGDRHQAIYGFRGADHDSIPNLEAQLAGTDRGLISYPLTVTRRCPRLVVEMARRIVPDLDYLPGAPDGEIVEVKPEQYLAVVAPGDMILCRTNAPLVSACYRLIRSGTKAIVRGRDIGKGLLVLLARLRARDVAGLVRGLADYRAAEAEKLSQLRRPEGPLQTLHDKCDCLLALAENATSVEEVKQRCEFMFSDLNEDNAVILSSVHRAKGLERDHIVIIRPDLLPGPWAERPEDVVQEHNLAYVAVTRSRRRLTFAGTIPEILT